MHKYLSLHIRRFQPFTGEHAHGDSSKTSKLWVLSSGVIHLWWAKLDLPDKHSASLAALLSPEEKNRADRLLGKRQPRFIAAHGLLRMLLGRYQDLEPADIFFGCSAKGKPYLCPEQNIPKIHFSLSHSGEMGMFGFCGDRAIGVDIEQIRPIDNMEAIAGRVFTEPESAALYRAEIPLKQALFFRLWTMKEAWIKAAGEGLSGLRQINGITIPGDEHGRNDWQRLTDRSGLSWMLRPCVITAGYAAAVAVSDIETSNGLS
jgi:4'-phosphopantetheinyl transferase